MCSHACKLILPSPQLLPAGLPLVHAQLAFAPAVPPPCTHKHPVHMVAELESVTRTLHISPLHKYRAWTFNGSVGRVWRGREG